MSKKDFSDLEDQIRDTLKNAINAIDFARIKEDINDKTESTLNEVKTKLKDKSQYLNEKMKNNRYYKYRDVTDVARKNKNEVQMYIAKRPTGSISGILYVIFGSIGAVGLGALSIGYSIFTSLFSVFSTTSFVTLGFMLFFFLSSIAMTLTGINSRKRIKRFRKYVNTLNNNKYCSIEELADSIRKKNKFVVRDLRKMIDLGMFPQGHIDDKKSYFMLNDEVYEEYLNSQQALKYRQEAELRRQEELKEEINDPERKELRSTLEIGKNYIEQIKSANYAINREEISQKLYRLESIVSQIFIYLENNPKKLTEVNKFTNHYLPMTLKLVNAYKQLNEQPVQGDNITSAKAEIEKTIDTINSAFEKLLDDLFGEVALDISTDISVLETLLTQEGLTKNEFRK